MIGPALAYGAGDSSLDYTPDQHIVLGEFMRLVDVLEEVMRKLVEAVGD